MKILFQRIFKRLINLSLIRNKLLIIKNKI